MTAQTALKTQPPLYKSLTGIAELSANEINDILDLADHYVVQNRRRTQTAALLKNMTIINLFLENSTRTRLSFEIAAKRLGADIVNMAAAGSSLRKGETLRDTLLTINAMLPDLVVIRHPEDGAAIEAANAMDCPVINAGDGMGEHPTQALLDALTLRRHFGTIDGLNITICGDILHSRVAKSGAVLLKKLGALVTLAGPKELVPPGMPSFTDIGAALKDADAVMMLRIQKERLEKALSYSESDYFKKWGLTQERIKVMKPDAVVMHPGPMNRGVEIDSAIADDPKRSLITTQVEMGVAVRMACLDLLTRRKR